MKKLMLGAAMAAAIAAPAVANAETNAVVGLQYSNSDYGSGIDFDAYGVNGAFNHDFGSWTFQADAATNRIDFGGCCIAQSYAAAHATLGDESLKYGAFVTLQDLFIYSGLGVGVEGQWNLSNVTFNGSIGYVDFGDLDSTGTNIAVDGSYFFTPNFSVGASLSYLDFESLDGTTWGVGGEYRFANSPASVTLGYHSADYDYADVDTWTIGLNFDLGTGSLQERAHAGPSLNGAATLNNTFSGFGIP